MPTPAEIDLPREMPWATSTFVVLSIVVQLGAGFSLSLGGRLFTRPGTAMLLALEAPGFIALILAATEHGFGGIKRLLSPALIWRVPIRWYLAAIAMPTLVGLAAVELSSIQSYVLGESVPLLRPLWVFWYSYTSLRFALFESWLMFPLMIGWCGYALPRLQETHGALTSALILGACFVIMTQAASLIGLPSGFIQTMWVVPCLIGSAVWLTWLYNNTNGSLLLATLMATILNANIVLLYFSRGRGLEIASIAIVLVAIVLIARFGWKSLSPNDTRVRW